MANKILTTALLLILGLSIAFADDANILNPDPKFGRTSKVKANIVLVRFLPGNDNIESGINYLESIGLKVQKPLLLPSQSIRKNINLAIIDDNKSRNYYKILKAEEPLLRSYYVEFEGNKAPEVLSAMLKKNRYIEIAEPYYISELLAAPNDPKVGVMDNLKKVKALEAWDIFDGDSNVVVGISDNGVFQQHEDIINSIKPNVNEIPGDGIDNDENGYIDDYTGYNFSWVEDKGNPNETFHFRNDHGSNTAGIAAATYNNGIGVTGTAGKCKMFPMKVALNSEDRTLTYSYESIIYAGVRGFSVLNCSWGSEHTFSEFENSIVQYAIANDVAIVASGGNSSNNILPYYPAGYPGVLGVGEVFTSDHITGISTMGAHIDILSPGQGNWTTSNIQGNYTEAIGGTSSAAPMVSGFVALVRAYYPYLNNLQALEFARQCTDDVSAINFGWEEIIPGRLNMLKAFQREPNSIPGIRYVSHEYTINDGFVMERFNKGDTLTLNISAFNHLGEANNAKFVLSVAYDDFATLSIIDSLVELPKVEFNSALEINRFRLKVHEIHHDLFFLRVDIYADNDYHDFFLIPVTTAGEVTTFANDAVSFSVGDRGTIGFAGSENNEQGEGFSYYKVGNQLFKAGLMISADDSKVVSSLFGLNINGSDFEAVKPFAYPDRQIGIMTDNKAAASEKIGLEITQEFELMDGMSSIASVVCTIKNISNFTLNNLSAGYFFDWDLKKEADLNIVEYLPEAIPFKYNEGNAAAEFAAHSDDPEFPVFGSASKSDYPGAIAQAAGLNYNITGNFSKDNQIKSLNSGVSWQLEQMPDDISYVVGMRFPGEMKPQETRQFTMCFGASDTKQELAVNLMGCLDSTTVSVQTAENNSTAFELYPNPAGEKLIIKTGSIPEGEYTVEIIDIYGKASGYKYIKYIYKGESFNIPLNNFADGVYLVRINNKMNNFTKRFIKMD